MRIRTFCTFAPTAIAAFLLAGCATAVTAPKPAAQGYDRASQSTRIPSVLGPWAQPRPEIPLSRALVPTPDVSPPVVTTAQIYHDDLTVYGESTSGPVLSKMIKLTFLESITSGISAPQGAVATIGGDWYVTNSGTSTILVYRYNGSTFTLIKTLDDPGQVPGDVDTNQKESLVAVSNVGGTSSNPASVSIYAHGSTSPTGTLHAPDALKGVGIAIDAKGNCFWSYESTSSAAKIVEFLKCSGGAKTIPVTPSYAGGLAFDGANNLYYADPLAAKVFRCAGLSSCTAFKQAFVSPVFINFDQGWKHLWVADFGGATIYGLSTKTGKTISITPAVGGSSDPPLGIAPIPGSKY